MKIFAIIILILTASVAAVRAQKTFEVQDFSKDYYGKVYLAQPAEVFSPGWVAIFDKKTNRQLIKVEAEELTNSETEDGKAKANVKELPYGEQSAIIYDDFNFDGVKDFAIMDGQNSCYHGPSFQIYLGGKVRGRFVLNKQFTRLAQEYCGMFEIDPATKKISTMTKSGCCWHQFSEFTVVGNTPKAVRIVEDDATGFPFTTTSTEIWNGSKKRVTSVRSIDLENEDLKELFSFKTNDGRRVILFSSETELHYAFVGKAGNIEFAYPKDAVDEQDPKFALDSKENPAALTFKNKSATYKVYETGEKIGVEVTAGGKTTDIPGDSNGRKGGLRDLVDKNLSNVTFKQ